VKSAMRHLPCHRIQGSYEESVNSAMTFLFAGRSNEVAERGTGPRR